MAWGDDARSRNQVDYAQNQVGAANQYAQNQMGNANARSGGQIDYQRNRFEQQQNPIMEQFARNYGQGTEQGMGDYTDIMNRYRQLYTAAGTPEDGGGGGGGGGGYGMVDPYLINVKDPFNSYAGYQEFSQTGGYSPDDVANMRARGISPIRAAYANAQRGISRQRSLQGGYSPNATASMARMAREQGQAGADATQNVEAGLAQMRNQGRLAGLGGMTDVEKERYAMDYKQQVYNAQAQASAASQNASAAGANAAASRASAEANTGNQFKALSGMTNLYGTTPGMADTFGRQVLGGLDTGAQFGIGTMGAENNRANTIGQGATGYQQNINWGQNAMMGGRNQASSQPGNLERGINLAGTIANTAAPWVDYFGNRNRQPQQPVMNSNPYTFGGSIDTRAPVSPRR